MGKRFHGYGLTEERRWTVTIRSLYVRGLDANRIVPKHRLFLPPRRLAGKKYLEQRAHHGRLP
jgi:hypothetical protein